MDTLIGIVFGALGGFAIHAISMQVNFKQRTIDNKIKVYDQLVIHWVKMRNFIVGNSYFTNGRFPAELSHQFDQMYGESQTFVGEVFLICEDAQLAMDINDLNERIYRADWQELDVEARNERLDQLKADAIPLLDRMREDVRSSTRLTMGDLWFMFGGRSRN